MEAMHSDQFDNQKDGDAKHTKLHSELTQRNSQIKSLEEEFAVAQRELEDAKKQLKRVSGIVNLRRLL